MIGILLMSAFRAVVLASSVGLLMHIVRLHHPAVRKVCWATVLVCSFTMPLLSGHMVRLDLANHLQSLPKEVPKVLSSHLHDNAKIWLATVDSAPESSGPHLALFGLYAAVAAFLLLRTIFGLVAAYRIWRRSSISGFGASVRVSEQIRSPWTFGSCILLPTSAEHWPAEVAEVVLSHERAHVRSGDFYLQLAAHIYTALFWFSPLGWWLQKECARLAEQTSDHAALLSAADPVAYAELLMSFAGAGVPRTGIAMARSAGLQSRLEYILSQGEFMNRFSAPFRSSAGAAVCLPLCLGLATVSVRADALERKAERLVGTVTSRDHAGVEGFACTLENGTTVVGIHGASGIRVSVGTFTSQYVKQIKSKVGDLFVAFHQDGQDYVITDPSVVLQALALFQPKQVPNSKPAEQKQQPATATAREVEQQRQIEQLQAQIAALTQAHITDGVQSGASVAAINPFPRDATKRLEALIVSSQQSGKVSRLAL